MEHNGRFIYQLFVDIKFDWSPVDLLKHFDPIDYTFLGRMGDNEAIARFGFDYIESLEDYKVYGGEKRYNFVSMTLEHKGGDVSVALEVPPSYKANELVKKLQLQLRGLLQPKQVYTKVVECGFAETGPPRVHKTANSNTTWRQGLGADELDDMERLTNKDSIDEVQNDDK